METIDHHDSDEEDEHHQRSIQSTVDLERANTIASDATIHTNQDGKQSIIQTERITTNNHLSILSSSSSSSPPISNIAWWKRLFLQRQSSSRKDLVDPRTFSFRKKTMILAIVATAGAASPLASTIYYPALIDMEKAFNASDTAMNASISIFTFFTAFFPLLWASAGDRVGRRKIYLTSFMISVTGSICCALSVNITMLIIFRAFSAIGSSSVMSMGAGTLADIYEAHERGRAFAWYTCGPLLGPALGPIIGGYLNIGFGFRATFYFLAIFNFCVFLAIFFFLPETWRPTVIPTLNPQEKGQQQKKKNRMKNRINPLEALNLLLNLNIALTVTFVGVLTYESQYGMDSGTAGLCYLPNAVGCMIGGILGGRMSDRKYNREVIKLQENNSDDQPYPEMRLGGIQFYGAILLNLFAMIGYGWCVQENVHWAYGVVCQFFIGIALMVPNVTLSAYMVDCFRKRGASVTACNNFARYIMAGIGSLVSSSLMSAMGPGPMFTMLGSALVIFTLNLILVQFKANTWRMKKLARQQEKELQATS
ncbi:major facilitator superfamily domain-containing protein [Halteromyces radiatus]|uniref:major facilitator superfamily domain-containing protein n=1 Tax=Halteromyces radiatus TaxID=101107 RepID=UPI00221E5D6E|nr:major facilitator superfamily domain-containing protein [Halteromyces radiatus]KAI8097157.1 major facilitator superfamily domain-containing protein [Halteromyces radiatus]